MGNQSYLFAITDAQGQDFKAAGYMDYKTIGGAKWRAEYLEGQFIHSPNGDRSKSHKDIYLAYTEPGGKNWHMTIEDGKFVLREKREGNVIKRTDECRYYDWEGKERIAKIIVPGNSAADMGKQLQDAMGDVLKNLGMKE